MQSRPKPSSPPESAHANRAAAKAAQKRMSRMAHMRVSLLQDQLALIRTDRVEHLRATLRILREAATELVAIHEDVATFLVYEYSTDAPRTVPRSDDYAINESYGEDGGISMSGSLGIQSSVAYPSGGRRRRLPPGIGGTHLKLRAGLQALLGLESDLFLSPEEDTPYHIPNQETAGVMLMRELGATIQQMGKNQAGGGQRQDTVTDLIHAYAQGVESKLPQHILDSLQAKIEVAMRGVDTGLSAPVADPPTDVLDWKNDPPDSNLVTPPQGG